MNIAYHLMQNREHKIILSSNNSHLLRICLNEQALMKKWNVGTCANHWEHLRGNQVFTNHADKIANKNAHG